MKNKWRVGILGCGTIGSQFARAVEKQFSKNCRLVGLSDHHSEKIDKLRHLLKGNPKAVDWKELVDRSDLVIEAASPAAVAPLLRRVLPKKKKALVMSVGGLLERGMSPLLKQNSGCLYLPSGAIAGIDGLLGARVGKIRHVTLCTRKSPRSLIGAPYLQDKKISLEKMKKAKRIFSGTARQAVKAFPQNINVAALVSLAGLGPEKTRVEIIADPKIRRNVHELRVEGDFGRMTTVMENFPSRQNPKTSAMAMLSPIALLEKILQPTKIGT